MTDDHGRRAPSASGGPSAAPDPADVARLRLVLARLYRQMAQASGGDRELTFSQISALARTDQYGPLRIGELAAHEQVAAPSLTRTVQPLAAAGLIRKEPDPSDGRSSLVSITPAGRELLGEVRRERSELLSRRLSRLTPEQLDTLLAALPVLELLQYEPKDEAVAATGQG
ncbi:MarR family winged helix-turn-helix transcriptional regulator [Streptomyces sp. CA-111067]|uniref:MarR family winged helix-turn-helix transcriptional regulator n=1 Tax=Streptomyces sp. CA-111067 TaxID=3240046 RepID=UPI003D9889DC